MKASSLLLVVAALVCLSLPGQTDSAEPYPFETRRREVRKTEWLNLDFESGLPPGATLGTGAKIEDKVGSGGSKGLISSGKGVILSVPIQQTDVDISRFDVMLEYGGEGFSLFTVRLNAYNRQGKKLRSVTVGSQWGYAKGLRQWELRTADLEFEDIYGVELEIEQTTDEGTTWIDNIVVHRHELPAILGRTARKDLTSSLTLQDIRVDDVGDLWVATTPERVSYFDFSRIDENKRYVRSEWEERLHLGTTYKKTRGRTPTFMLGVSARQAALEAAATRQKKTLVEMYEVFLDDVAAHHFNCVWVDFNRDLAKFDQLAEARGISVIIRDPVWNNIEKWIAKPSGPMPAEFKQAIDTTLPMYDKMNSVIGYHTNRPLSRTYQPMLAEARKYMATVAPNLQLVDEQSDIYAAENIEEPYPHLGIQQGTYGHYLGRPWGAPSHLYHPNYWTRSISEGWYRRIYSGFRVRYVPTLWSVPTGKQYGKKSIGMQADRVITATTNWIQEGESDTWSGWYRYEYPPNMLTALVWKAIESGAEGILFEEWGPASIPADITGSDIYNDSKYANGTYDPHTLRLADMSESDGWRELGVVAAELAKYRTLFADTTQHGHNNAHTNNSNVRVRTLTGRTDPVKLLVIVNTKIGEYDEEALSIDPETGALQNYEPAEGISFELTVERDYGLIDMQTGKTIEPTSVSTKDKAGKYDMYLGPGQGVLLYRGKPATFARFVERYKIPVDSSRTASTSGQTR